MSTQRLLWSRERVEGSNTNSQSDYPPTTGPEVAPAPPTEDTADIESQDNARDSNEGITDDEEVKEIPQEPLQPNFSQFALSKANKAAELEQLRN
jgi:hypothetical protein